jgi:hypothetical protein
MKHLSQFFQQVMTTVGLITAFGVFMHDGRVDKAYTTSLEPASSPLVLVSVSTQMKKFIDADTHTHPDHNTGRYLMNSFTYQSPSVPPRKEHVNKLSLRLLELGGRHAFDNTNLPLLFD